jgi:hypothetical protein
MSKKKQDLNADKFDDLFLNRALHCNQMIIHTNGGMRIVHMQKKRNVQLSDLMTVKTISIR